MNIDAKTKVGAMLNEYPFLEEVLIGVSSKFEKLRNPVLRRTVAKFTPLEHAAGVAGIPVEELVDLLREKVREHTASES